MPKLHLSIGISFKEVRSGLYRHHLEGAGLTQTETLGIGVKFIKKKPKAREVSHDNLGYISES